MTDTEILNWLENNSKVRWGLSYDRIQFMVDVPEYVRHYDSIRDLVLQLNNPPEGTEYESS